MLSLMLLSGCGKKETTKTKIVTSCYPVHIIAKNICNGIENLEILPLSETHTGCLHDFVLQTDDLKKLEDASTLIINGAGMETFLDKIIIQIPNIKIIDSSENISLLQSLAENEPNPHIWLSPENYIKQIENISKNLQKITPENAEKYKENTKNYISKIKNLQSEIQEKLSTVKNKNLVTYHDAFPYFAEEFGLKIAAVIKPDHETTPSAKKLTEITKIIKNLDIKTIFAEKENKSIVVTLSKETNTKIKILDPISSGKNINDAYINMMKKNLANIIEDNND